MSVVYFDTSALVKLCVLETGTPLAVALWREADAVVTSRIADAEVRSVLAAAERIGRIDAAPAAQARERWDELWPSLAKIEVSPALMDHAAALADRRPLRAGDATHLASALTLMSAGLVMAAWDRRLVAAARAEGLTVLPPTLA
ncbi:type II toxin-antitoxin system VapC family toxin [Demequina sp. NBRC 110051]|uniref:type II toxin-antitoxin system VapC family toxin n=1 Tax=Demequina sp. NBRC 110051 TaxID=1570340 RepID=UPI0009FBB073|nr:type II toxin-antitoxin system VapC family toxin [Demequina sp. NBRC 110051]